MKLAATAGRNKYFVHCVSRHDLVLLAFVLASTTPVTGQCLECGPDAISENEPNCGLDAAGEYDDFVNGGCYAAEPRFTSIELGTTICGTAAMNTTTGVRDTDWYELVLTEETDILWMFSSEFRSIFGIVDNAGVPDCAAAHCFLIRAGAGPFHDGDDDCFVQRMPVLLPAGTWWFYVSPVFQEDTACELPYTSRVVVRQPADVNRDGEVNIFDVNLIVYAWGPVDDWVSEWADIDGDGTVGILDLLLLLELWPI